MKKIISRFSTPWIVIPVIVLIVLGIRILYMSTTQYPIFTDDSGNYYYYANHLFTDNFLAYFFNNYRTPGYPIFLALIMFLSGHFNAALYSRSFYQGLNIVVYTQTILGVLEIPLLYITLRQLKIRNVWAYCCCLFIGMDIMLFWQERTILTESITTFWLMLLVFVYIITLKNPSWKKFLAVLVLFIIGFFVRPSYVLLPILLLPIIALYHKKRWVTWFTVIILIVYFLIPGLYIYKNVTIHNYAGVTQIADINVMGRILRFNIPVESGRDVPFFYTTVNDYRARGGNTQMPYWYLSFYDPSMFYNSGRMNDLQKFTRQVMIGTFPQYFGSVLTDLPHALTDTPADDLLPIGSIKSPPLRAVFTSLFTVYKYMQYVTFAIFVFLPITFASFFSRKNFRVAALMFLGLLSIYQIGVTLVYGYGEWGRLVGAGQTVFYLFSFFWIAQIIHPHVNRARSSKAGS